MEHRSDAPGPKGRAFSNRRGRGTRTSILVIFCIFSSAFSPVSSVVSENSEVWKVAVVEPESLDIVAKRFWFAGIVSNDKTPDPFVFKNNSQ